MKRRGHSVLKGLADALYFLKVLSQTPGSLLRASRNYCRAVYFRVQFYFSGTRNAFRRDSGFLHLNLQRLEENSDKRNRDRRIARYTSTLRLLLDYMKGDGDRGRAGRRRAALDIWIG